MSSFEFPQDIDPQYFFDPSPETVQSCNNALDQLPGVDLRYFNQNASMRIDCGRYTVIGSVGRIGRQFKDEMADEYSAVSVSVYDQTAHGEEVIHIVAPQTTDDIIDIEFDVHERQAQANHIRKLLHGRSGADISWIRVVLEHSASTILPEASGVTDMIDAHPETIAFQTQNGHHRFNNGTEIKTYLVVPSDTKRSMPITSASEYANVQLTTVDGKQYNMTRYGESPACLDITHVLDQDIPYVTDEYGQIDETAYVEAAEQHSIANVQAAQAGVHALSEGKLREFMQALVAATSSGTVIN